MKRYIFIVDGEVGPDLVFEESTTERAESLAAILSSDPKVLEIDVESEVEMGWTWDGTNFFPPKE